MQKSIETGVLLCYNLIGIIYFKRGRNMIYEKNRSEKSLNRSLFEKPTSEYRAAPFWAWNCRLEHDELLRQIDIFREMGFGGFHMHVRTGLATPYLGDEFMDLVRDCALHARENNMLAWLYDEDRYASGPAGGIVTKDRSLRGRRVLFRRDRLDYDADTDPVLLARYDVKLNDKGDLVSYRMLDDSEKDEAEGTLLYAYRTLEPSEPWHNGQTYIDAMNPRAVDRFLEVTHEKYYEKVGDLFGGTVPAIFTDEPHFNTDRPLTFAKESREARIPWTDDLDASFREKYGVSLLEHLPELFFEKADGVPSVIRYRFHDHVCDRFSETFAGRYGAWCEKHGILMTGHLFGEDTLFNQTSAIGEAMRSYPAFGIPGIDMLVANRELTTAKQTQSVVRQYGKAGMTSELYGVTNWDFDFRGFKLYGDWQAALGVTVRVPHLSWVSMKGEAKRDYPGSISYQSPYYPEFSYVEDHFARVNTALTRGKAMVRIGVIHPIESYWLHYGPNDRTGFLRAQLDENFKNITEWLLYGGLDFDFISEALLPSVCEKGTSPLCVGEMKYDVIIVPACETLRPTTYERLEAFAKDGGKLIILGDAPKYENALPTERGKKLSRLAENIEFQREPLVSALEPFRTLELRGKDGSYTDNILHCLRRDTDGVWLFLSHCKDPYNRNVPRKETINLRLRGTYFPQIWDTQTGKVYGKASKRADGFTYMTLDLFDYDSALIFFADDDADGNDDAGLPEKEEKEKRYGREISVSVPKKVAYTLSEPNVYLLDKACMALDGGEFSPETEILRGDNELRDALGIPRRSWNVLQPYAVKNREVTHKATMKFTVLCETPVTAPLLALEDADVAEITCNGEAVPNTDCGYYIDRSIRKVALPPLDIGENVITVTLPFGESTDLEYCYLLGNFGVKIAGEERVIVKTEEKVGFDDVAVQGLAHFGGVLTYKIPVTLPENGTLKIHAPHFSAHVMTVTLDGEKKSVIAYSPYTAELGGVKKGEHMLEINAYIPRYNCLSPLHLADAKTDWIGPDAWRTTGDLWTECYRLRPSGLLGAPTVTLLTDKG